MNNTAPAPIIQEIRRNANELAFACSEQAPNLRCEPIDAASVQIFFHGYANKTEMEIMRGFLLKEGLVPTETIDRRKKTNNSDVSNPEFGFSVNISYNNGDEISLGLKTAAEKALYIKTIKTQSDTAAPNTPKNTVGINGFFPFML